MNAALFARYPAFESIRISASTVGESFARACLVIVVPEVIFLFEQNYLFYAITSTK